MEQARSCPPNAPSFSTFKERMLQFTPPSLNSTCNFHNPKFITRLRVELSDVHEHRSKESFPDSTNALCNRLWL